MELEKFENMLQKECENALKEILEMSKKFEFSEEILLVYGSGYLMGYLGTWLRNEKIVKLNEIT